MGVDKGHCTEGIRTGSLSNSPLEKEQQVKRGIQRRGGRGRGEVGERLRATSRSQTGWVSTSPSFFTPSSTSSSSRCPLITVRDTRGAWRALIKQQQIAGTQELNHLGTGDCSVAALRRRSTSKQDLYPRREELSVTLKTGRGAAGNLWFRSAPFLFIDITSSAGTLKHFTVQNICFSY